IRTDNGKEVIIPNATIIEDMVINYSRLPHIRIRTPFAVPIGENYAQVKAEVLRLMKENPYFVEGEPFYVTMNGITSSAVEMEVIGQVTVDNLEPCKHWIYEVIATQMEIFNTYDPDQENILILPQSTPTSNSAPTTPLPMPGALPSTTEGITPTSSNPNSVATPLGPLDKDLVDKLKNLDEPTPISHLEKELNSKFLNHLLDKVDDAIIKPDQETSQALENQAMPSETAIKTPSPQVSVSASTSTPSTDATSLKASTASASSISSKASSKPTTDVTSKASQSVTSQDSTLSPLSEEEEDDSLAQAIA
ncbi:MAG: mechanosensitive ion channel family protein, partial [Allobaculum sp.]|nr:mechanosensitive ion channel family protein [Allobaculum sp.]